MVGFGPFFGQSLARDRRKTLRESNSIIPGDRLQNHFVTIYCSIPQKHKFKSAHTPHPLMHYLLTVSRRTGFEPSGMPMQTAKTTYFRLRNRVSGLDINYVWGLIGPSDCKTYWKRWGKFRPQPFPMGFAIRGGPFGSQE